MPLWGRGRDLGLNITDCEALGVRNAQWCTAGYQVAAGMSAGQVTGWAQRVGGGSAGSCHWDEMLQAPGLVPGQSKHAAVAEL